MEIISYQIVKTISQKLDSTTSGVVTLYENSGEQNTLPNTDVISINSFIKSLKAYAKITSLDAINMPNIALEDSDSERLNKLLNTEWGSPRKQINLLISDGGDWQIVGAVSLLNPSSYPFRRYNLQDLYTDNLAIELGTNGKIGVQIIDVGHGLLSGSDVVTIYGSYLEEINVAPLSKISSTSPFTSAITNSSSIIIAANNNRKYIAITNNSIVDCYINLGSIAYLNQGIYLAANGGSYELNTNEILYYGAISAVSNNLANLSGLEAV